MEQKQLDEIDESYFGEEFIDDDSLEEVKIETPKKKTAKKKADKLAEATEIKPAVEVKEEVVKEEVKPKPIETNDPIDPWADEEETSLFAEASTWKAITGILVILLLFSVFSGGFNFSEEKSLAVDEITLQDAEGKALDFVNSYLLQPPFVAEVETSSDLGNLYMITLNVAGQSVESYLTKDGELFFPQGISTSDVPAQALLEEPVDLEEVEVNEEPVTVEKTVADEPIVENTPVNSGNKSTNKSVVVEPTKSEPTTKSESTNSSVVEEKPVAKEPEVVEKQTVDKNLAIAAKKWLFTPDVLKVKKGDVVSLQINPQGLDFTFSITGLGVEQEISGATTVKFAASKVGSFDFTCSSCEDWRGMSGTLVVE